MDVTETGDGSLEDFVEHFTDGQVQFGLARVTVPGSDVSKNILLGWCPDSAPAKLRLSFANNFADVSRVLSGYHVQITARDQDDLDVNEFLNRVGAAAGARYSTQTSGLKNHPLLHLNLLQNLLLLNLVLLQNLHLYPNLLGSLLLQLSQNQRTSPRMLVGVMLKTLRKETLTRNLWITFHRHINQQRLTLTN